MPRCWWKSTCFTHTIAVLPPWVASSLSLLATTSAHKLVESGLHKTFNSGGTNTPRWAANLNQKHHLGTGTSKKRESPKASKIAPKTGQKWIYKGMKSSSSQDLQGHKINECEPMKKPWTDLEWPRFRCTGSTKGGGIGGAKRWISWSRKWKWWWDRWWYSRSYILT